VRLFAAGEIYRERLWFLGTVTVTVLVTDAPLPSVQVIVIV